MKQRADPTVIVRLYLGGWSMRQVGERVGVSFERVRQVLTKLGVPRRPKHITRHAGNYAGRKGHGSGYIDAKEQARRATQAKESA